MIGGQVFLRAIKKLRAFGIHLATLKEILTRKNLAKTLPVILVICFLFTTTGVSFFVIRAWERQRFENEYEVHADTLADDLQTNLTGYIDILYSIESLYRSSTEVTRQEFHTFTERLLSRHPGIQALEWIPRVPDSERAVSEAAARLDGYSQFQFTERKAQGQMIPAAPCDEYYPVYYVEPYKGNEIALGYDLASNPERLEALNKARDTGEATATARIILVQETAQQFGILIYVPIYNNGSTPSAVEERRQNLRGFALGVFRIGDIVDAFMDTAQRRQLNIELYDETAPSGERLLYKSQPNAEYGEDYLSDYQEERKNSTGLQRFVRLNMAGRQWVLRITPTPDYLATSCTWYSWIILLAGLIFTSLIGYYMLVGMRRALNIEKLAIDLSESNLELGGEVDRRKKVEECLELRNRSIRNLWNMATMVSFSSMTGD